MLGSGLGCPLTETPDFLWLHTDPLGTPLVATRGTYGAVVVRASYEPFGEATVDPNPDGDSLQEEMFLRFPGQLDDESLGLHYNFFRTYDPRTGRYLEADPIGQAGGIGVYHYALNSPTTLVAPRA